MLRKCGIAGNPLVENSAIPSSRTGGRETSLASFTPQGTRFRPYVCTTKEIAEQFQNEALQQLLAFNLLGAQTLRLN